MIDRLQFFNEFAAGLFFAKIPRKTNAPPAELLRRCEKTECGCGRKNLSNNFKKAVDKMGYV